MGTRRSGGLFALFGLVILISLNSFADDVYARIRGIVKDQSGAALSGATLTARNVATGIEKTTTSQSDGAYEFVNLPIGVYTVKVTSPSFRTFESTQILLAVNQIYNLPVQMTVGTITETVEVKANAVQVESTSNQLQTLVDQKKIVDLPLINRDWTSLEQLIPGVVAASDRFLTFSVNGSQSTQSSFLINGVDANDLPLNQPLIIPSPDALGEFNLITNTINPEYGRNSGGIVNAVIKNGTNSFHGDVFEFYRDTFLNTHNFFQNKTPVFHQNLFGGTLGGPIFKDKTFFFLSYQGDRNRQPQPRTSNIVTVFTPAQRSGDFSTAAGGCPFGTKVSPFALTGQTGAVFPAGTPYCTIFPTGHIPTSDFNSISANLLNKFVPLPNFGSNNNQFSFNPTRIGVQDQGIARIDHTISSKDSIWGVMFFNHLPNVDDLPFTGATVPGFGENSQNDSRQFIADWNHTFNANTLNEFRLGYTRLNLVTVNPTTPVAPSSLGFNINPQLTSGQSIPRITITGLFTLGFSINGPQPRIDQTYQLTDNFTKIVGRHSLKFGFDGRRFDVDNPFSARNNGSFSFSRTARNSTGVPGADFLLGIPASYAQTAGGLIIARAYESYLYVQDSWKARPNLTVNYGTGWQIDTPLDNFQFGGLAVNCFRPGEQSTVFPTAPLGLVYPKDKNCNKAGGYDTKLTHFGPRAGFVYAPDWGRLSGGSGASKLSIRAGWGLYFNRTEEEGSLQNLGAPPFGLNTIGAADVGGSPSFANPFADISGNAARSESNKFPFTAPAVGSNVDFSPFLPFSINVFDPNLSTPYAMNYNLTIQRELPGSMIMSVGYVGSQARRLLRSFEGNSVTLAGAARCAANPQCANDATFKADFPNLSPFPGNIYESLGTQGTTGKSHYNAFQASLNKNLTQGLTFLFSYTWSHAIDDGSGLEDSGFNLRGTNVLVPGLNIGDSAFDARHRFVASYSYLVPNLHNKFHQLPSMLFGGWQLTGITTLQTGFPVTLGDTGQTSLTCDANTFYACPDTPNQVAAVHTLDPRNSSIGGVNHVFFNPADFVAAAPGTFGNVRRNSFHGPGLNNTDFAIFKNTQIGDNENRYVQLRLEGYNVFNHTQFCTATSCVDGDIQSPTFGQISAAQPGRLVQLGAKFYF